MKLKRIVALLLAFAIVSSFVITADATKYNNDYTGAMAGDGKIYTQGIDVSKWNKGQVDFTQVKNAGYTYVIIKCGSTSAKDSCFEEFYTQAKDAGLDVGVYYYSYATTVEGAISDAERCLSWIKGKTFEYPIYFDYEDETQVNLDGTLSARICYAFLDKLKDEGYLVGLYSMASWLEQSWVTSSGLRDDYEGWVARYMNSGDHETMDPTYSTRYGMYQYTAEKYINGKGPFDANVCYKDYPSIVKKYGFNGYEAENSLKNNEKQKLLKSLVFDAQFYADSNSDLKAAFGYDEEKLYDHFLNNGIKEGRCASPYFDVAWYMNHNDAGLVAHCNGDYMTAYLHFLQYVDDPNEMTGTPKSFSKILDINYYSKKYVDLKNAGFKTQLDYLSHFASYGVNEWRQASAQFDPVSYAHFNPDTFAAFGTESSKSYFYHYMSTGQFETNNPYRALVTNYADLGEAFYANITDANSTKNLELIYNADTSEYADKNAIVINSPAKSESQMWKFERQADGSYKITNVMYNKLLDAGRNQLSALDEKTGDDISDQRWYLYYKDGYCVMKAASRNVVVDVNNALKADGTYVYNNYYDGDYNQQFKITAVKRTVGLLGDVNNDEVISVMDVTNIQFSLASLCELSEYESIRADVDADSNVSITDATQLQRYLAQYSVSYPVGEDVEIS